MKIAQLLEKPHVFSARHLAPHNCNICSAPLKTRHRQVRDTITNEFFSILACPKCGLGHTIPHPSDLRKYYGNNYYGNRHGVTSRICTRRSIRVLESLRRKSTGKRLLDVGCGDGSFLLNARDNGWKVTGTEVNFHPAQAFGLDIRPSIHHIDHNEKFDCITFWHSLEHMKDIKATLFSIAGMLDTEGHLVIAVPNSDSLQAKIFGPNWLHLDVPRHLYHFNRFSLNFSLEKAGFHIHNTIGNELEYNLIGWSQSAMNCFNLKPNLFFHFLTGKVKDYSAWNKASNLILGSTLTLLFSSALFVETLAERNGTIVITARKN